MTTPDQPAAPVQQGVTAQIHEHDESFVRATLRAPKMHEYALNATRDDLTRNWYIEVTDEGGYRLYDGYWRDSNRKSCAEVLVEAAHGSGLGETSLSHPAPGAGQQEVSGIYVASRASIPERPMMWQGLRLKGWPITSSWIDEAGEGETADMGELWRRIHDEIARSSGVLLYAEVDDFPLKGALIECGIALGMGKPVALVLPDVRLEPRSMKPLGSWAAHPLVTRYDTLDDARAALAPQGNDRG